MTPDALARDYPRQSRRGLTYEQLHPSVDMPISEFVEHISQSHEKPISDRCYVIEERKNIIMSFFLMTLRSTSDCLEKDYLPLEHKRVFVHSLVRCSGTKSAG